MAQRTFKHVGKRNTVEVTTELTDAQAIKLLGGYEGDSFNAKCAFEINKMAQGYKAKDALVAWGFMNAHDNQNPTTVRVLAAEMRERVRTRRPLTGEVAGFPFKVAQCGPRSRHCGKYTITGSGVYPNVAFYGHADEHTGEWKPTTATPEEIIAELTEPTEI